MAYVNKDIDDITNDALDNLKNEDFNKNMC